MNQRSLVKTEKLRKWFLVRQSFFTRRKYFVRAVDEVDLEIEESEAVGLVGESGSGKTTLGKLLLLLEEPTSGKILFRGHNLNKFDKQKLREFRKNVQMIFQNPYTSFDPRLSMLDNITEPLIVHNLVSSFREKYSYALELLSKVSLPENILFKYPHQLSGGQLQRASIARALALNPRFIVADEPTSMLDASLRLDILNVLRDLQNSMNLAVLLITHDIAAASYLTSKLYVMYSGKILECGSTAELINNPLHPYTKILMAAVLTTKSKKVNNLDIRGEPTQIYQQGCRFAHRCPYVEEKCFLQEPSLLEIKDGHKVSCFKVVL